MNNLNEESHKQERCCVALENSGAFYWEYDLGANLFLFSPKFNALLGYRLDDGVSQEHWNNLLHPDDRQYEEVLFKKLRQGEIKSYSRELRIGTSEGAYIWLHEQGIRLEAKDETPKIIGTHKVLAENETLISKERLRILYEHGDAWVWEIDPKGYLTYVHSHVKYLLGYEAQELFGKRVFDLMPKLEIKRLLPFYKKAFQTKEKIVDLLNVKVHKEGQSVYVRTNASAFFDEEGVFLGYRGIDQDVTQEIRLEQKLKKEKISLRHREEELTLANQKLMENQEEFIKLKEKRVGEAQNSKSSFLANMSDDIRNPMNAILKTAHTALEGELMPQKREYLQKIEVSTRSLLEVINDVLDLSLIETGKLVMHKNDFDLLKSIDDMMGFLDLQAQEKGLKIDISYGREVGRYYFGDDQRLIHVLTNLITNAIKFTQHGTIELFIDYVGVDRLRFEVRDSAMPLSLKEQEKLFQSFANIDSSTALGLAISKHFVEMMQGKIWCETAEDGNNFIFEVQLKEGQELSMDANAKELLEDLKSSMHTLKGSHILLVEDNFIDQEKIIKLIDYSGIVIDIAQNGEKALRMYQDKPSKYDLVLMDMQLPIMDGLEASKQIRNSGGKMPIVILTENLRQQETVKTQNIQIEDCLTKPIDVAKLYKALLKHIFSKTIMSKKIEKPKESSKFPHFNTLDTVLGLSYCENNRNLYIEVLHNFRAEYYGIYFEVLEQEELERTIKTLKSHSKNIAAFKLYNATQEYENDHSQPLLSKLYKELHNVIEEIEEKLVE